MCVEEGGEKRPVAIRRTEIEEDRVATTSSFLLPHSNALKNLAEDPEMTTTFLLESHSASREENR